MQFKHFGVVHRHGKNSLTNIKIYRGSLSTKTQQWKSRLHTENKARKKLYLKVFLKPHGSNNNQLLLSTPHTTFKEKAPILKNRYAKNTPG